MSFLAFGFERVKRNIVEKEDDECKKSFESHYILTCVMRVEASQSRTSKPLNSGECIVYSALILLDNRLLFLLKMNNFTYFGKTMKCEFCL